VKLPSLTRETSWVWSEDPALDAPPRPKDDADKDSPEVAAWKEWERRMQTARDTGQWDGLVKAGQKLAAFNLRIVPTVAWAKLRDSTGEDMGINSAFVLAVRLALMSVANLEDFEGKPHKVEHRHEDGYGRIATEATIDLLDAYTRAVRVDNPKASDLIVEMGAYILERQSGIRPLSPSA
jgi:hypothetical protein